MNYVSRAFKSSKTDIDKDIQSRDMEMQLFAFNEQLNGFFFTIFFYDFHFLFMIFFHDFSFSVQLLKISD